MNTIEHIINESLNFSEKIDTSRRPVVIYAGRFQPFHRGHFEVYQNLVEEYGEDNVIIASSNKQDDERSPFSFIDKKYIMTEVFNIPSGKIVQVKSPYTPVEITEQLPPNTPIIMPVSQKDETRLSNGNYFKKFIKEAPLLGYKDRAYYLVVPEFKFDVMGKNISGSSIRELMRSPHISVDKKKEMFEVMYGIDASNIFEMFQQRLKIPVNYTAMDETVAEPTDIRHIRIRNPNSGNKILLSAALEYSPEHPAHRAAREYIKSNNVVQEWLQEEDENMMHPYEELSLTFGDIRNIIKQAMTGFVGNNPVEKIDGQKLLFTVKQGVPLFARGKTHFKNNGEHALTAQQIIDKYAGRHEIGESFAHAVNDISEAVKKLSPHFVSDVFADGSKFMAIEIVYNGDTNVIPYNKNVIIFHYLISVDEDGNAVNTNSAAAENVVDALTVKQAHKQNIFSILKQNVLMFNPPSFDDEKRLHYFMSKLDKIMSEYNLSDSDTIGHFLATELVKKLKYTANFLPDELIKKLANQWIYGTRTIKASQFDNPELQQWFTFMESQKTNIKNDILKPIKQLILSVGAEAIRKSTNIMVDNVPRATEYIISLVTDALDDVEKFEGDKLVKLVQELEYLNFIGYDKIYPSEGVVFTWKGKIYKLTGAFAPLNKLLGTIRYSGLVDISTQQQSSPEIDNNKNIDYDRLIKNPETDNDIKLSTALSYPPEHPAHVAARRIIGT